MFWLGWIVLGVIRVLVAVLLCVVFAVAVVGAGLWVAGGFVVAAVVGRRRLGGAL